MSNFARGFARGLGKGVDAICATVPVGRVLGVPVGITGGLILVAIVDMIRSPGDFQLLVIVISSVFLHELGHVYVAQREGCEVHNVKLDIIGGTALMDIPRGTAKELRIAIAGPLVSIVLFLSAFSAYRWMSYEVLGQIGLINSAVAGFNLLPGFPMDGGRILRSLLTKHFGLIRATKIAVQVARIFFVLLILTAIIFGNCLLIVIAVFMWLSGTSELRVVERSERLSEQAS